MSLLSFPPLLLSFQNHIEPFQLSVYLTMFSHHNRAQRPTALHSRLLKERWKFKENYKPGDTTKKILMNSSYIRIKKTYKYIHLFFLPLGILKNKIFKCFHFFHLSCASLLFLTILDMKQCWELPVAYTCCCNTIVPVSLTHLTGWCHAVVSTD